MTLLSLARTGSVLATVALVAACGGATYANDWSDDKCTVARASVLMEGDINVGEYTVHCCEGTDENDDVYGCRG